MKVKLNGITRIVILFGSYAIKIPNFTNCHDHFLKGCCANWSERGLTILSKKWKDSHHLKDKIAPTIFCSWFGLVSIQVRVEPLQFHLTEEQREDFKCLTTDIKKENFGYLNGKMVCIDYA